MSVTINNYHCHFKYCQSSGYYQVHDADEKHGHLDLDGIMRTKERWSVNADSARKRHEVGIDFILTTLDRLNCKNLDGQTILMMRPRLSKLLTNSFSANFYLVLL